jgi:hypothetical protein
MKNNLKTAAQTYGRFKAWTTSITATIVGIVLLVIFTNMYFTNKHFSSVDAEVVSAECQNFTETQKTKDSRRSITETTKTLYNCNLLLKYTVNGNIQTARYKKNGSESEINVGDTLVVDYNTQNPSQVKEGASGLVYGAVAGIIITLLFVCLSYVNLYLVTKSDTIAGVEGTLGFASNLRSALSQKKRNRNNNFF